MGGGGTTKTETENKPPEWAAPLFARSAAEANKIYDSGAGGNVYQGQTVADLGSNTQAGIAGVRSAAGNWSNPSYQNMLTAPTQSSQNLQGMASGQYLQEGNPYYRERLNNDIAEMASTLNSSFSGAGRYGSGVNQQVLGKTAGNMLLQGLESDYNRAMGNMLTANSQIDSANQNQLGLQNSSFANQLAGQQAVIGAGQIQDQNAQDRINADIRRFEAEDLAPWTRLGLLQSAAAGSAGNYGTNTQTQQTPSNPLQTIGAVGSTIGQAAMKSDRRLKHKCEHVGFKHGIPVWEFEYIGKPGRYRGVMAQEVAAIRPDAVVREDDGFLAVYYDKIGIEMEAL